MINGCACDECEADRERIGVSRLLYREGPSCDLWPLAEEVVASLDKMHTEPLETWAERLASDIVDADPPSVCPDCDRECTTVCARKVRFG